MSDLRYATDYGYNLEQRCHTGCSASIGIGLGFGLPKSPPALGPRSLDVFERGQLKRPVRPIEIKALGRRKHFYHPGCDQALPER